MALIALVQYEESHQCHFCGTDVLDGVAVSGERHWLSDCRPDLVEHEIGTTCTWHNLPAVGGKDCYAYQEKGTKDPKWGNKHEHFLRRWADVAMPLVHLHMKSRKMIPAMHPWKLEEWLTWLSKKVRSEAVVVVCDENGHQYIVQVWEIDFIMVPNVEDGND